MMCIEKFNTPAFLVTRCIHPTIWVVHAMPCNAMQSKAKQSKNLSYLSLDIGANCFSSKLELPTHIQVFKRLEKGVQN
jgi:hypothetical protein